MVRTVGKGAHPIAFVLLPDPFVWLPNPFALSGALGLIKHQTLHFAHGERS